MDSQTFENVEECLTYLGGYGSFQRVLTIVFFGIHLVPSLQGMMMYYVAADSSWICISNSTLCQLNGIQTSDNRVRCDMPRSEWKYTQPSDYSIITEFDLSCGREWMGYTATSMQFLGWSIGAFVHGIAANAFGRKVILFVCVVGLIIFGCVSAFAPNILLFMACRLLIGFFVPGVNSVLFTLMGETVDNKHRPLVTILIMLSYNFALLILTLKAYFIRNWRYLQIASSIPYVFILSFYKFIPESVHWLHLRGLKTQMEITLERIAKWNKKSLHGNLSISPPKQGERMKAVTNPLQLFNKSSTRKPIVALMYCWFMVSGVYNGFFLTADSFDISMYVNFILFSAVEVPSNAFNIFSCNRYGRKKTAFASLLMGSLCAIIVGAITLTRKFFTLRVIFGMLVQGGIVISFNCLFTWSMEILPTDIRSIGFGFVVATGRLGGITAPWIAKATKSFHIIAPFVTVGVLGLTSVAVMLYLPETKGILLKVDTIEGTDNTAQEIEAVSVDVDSNNDSAKPIQPPPLQVDSNI